MKKIILTVFGVLVAFVCLTNVYAANASISANKTSATVGDKVTVTVTINAATWNVTVSGSASDKIVGFNSNAENETTTKQYSIDTSKAGTYTVTLSGDVTDGVTDVNSAVSGSAVITVKEKQVTNTNTNTSGNTSSSGSTNQTTYTKSSDATLKALKLDMEGLSPSFNRYTYTYTLSVGSDVDSIKVTASPNHSKAHYSVSGNTNLKNGDNTVYITVTAENGATRTYKIIVTKAENPEKANAYLKNIIIENGVLKTEFARETLEYELEDIASNVKKLDISVFPENQNATFEISGNDELKEGANEIKILVTAEDKKTTKEYILKVNKKEASEEEIIQDTVLEDNNLASTSESNAAIEKLKTDSETQLLILVYILSVVEFFEILYLFLQLRNKDKGEDGLDTFEVKEKRRTKDIEEKENVFDIKSDNKEE